MREKRPYDKYFEKDGLAWKKTTRHLPPPREDDFIQESTVKAPSKEETDIVEVLAFLDNFFESSANDIDHPPDAGKSEIRLTRLDWTSIHSEYKERSEKQGIRVVSYSDFAGYRYKQYSSTFISQNNSLINCFTEKKFDHNTRSIRALMQRDGTTSNVPLAPNLKEW